MRKIILTGLLFTLMFIQCSKIGQHLTSHHQNIIINTSKNRLTDISGAWFDSGEIMIFYNRFSDSRLGDKTYLYQKSTTNGFTWTKPEKVFQTDFQINNPLVTKLFDNSLILVFNEDSNTVNVTDYFYLSRSYDYGKTFTVPRMIDLPGYREIKITGNIVQMGRSRLLLPLQAINQKRERLCLILISHNKGKSWDTLLRITSAIHNGQFNHPVLIPVKETLYCLLENEKGYQYSTCSYDSGKTWSKPECTNIYGKSANLLLSPDGYLLCCYQDETPQGLSMMKSFDRGKTWEKEIQVIEANHDIFYPYLFPLKNSGVLILYSQGKSMLDKSKTKWQVKGNFITLERIKTPKAVAASLKGDEVHLRWNKVKRASYYIVYRSSPADSPFGPEQRIAYPGLNKYVDYIVKNANKYYYSISAVEGYGKLLADTGSESALSQPVIIEVK